MADNEVRRIIEERLEKAERFLRTAQRAYRDGDYESAVSRAYYGVRHGIIALVPDLKDDYSHEQIFRECVAWQRRYTSLSSVGVLQGRRDLGSSLRSLYRWRNEADYRVGLTDANLARDALNFTRRFITVVKEIVS